MAALRLPILDNGGQYDAMRHIAEAGAAAVRDGSELRLVTAQMVLDAPAGQNASEIARAKGIPATEWGEVLGGDGAHITFRPDPRELPQFEVPAGYLQCPDNANHTYYMQSGLRECPVDRAKLSPVYLVG